MNAAVSTASTSLRLANRSSNSANGYRVPAATAPRPNSSMKLGLADQAGSCSAAGRDGAVRVEQRRDVVGIDHGDTDWHCLRQRRRSAPRAVAIDAGLVMAVVGTFIARASANGTRRVQQHDRAGQQDHRHGLMRAARSICTTESKCRDAQQVLRRGGHRERQQGKASQRRQPDDQANDQTYRPPQGPSLLPEGDGRTAPRRGSPSDCARTAAAQSSRTAAGGRPSMETYCIRIRHECQRRNRRRGWSSRSVRSTARPTGAPACHGAEPIRSGTQHGQASP